MDADTLKRALHTPEVWRDCPLTWDEQIDAARRALGFDPQNAAMRAAWLADAQRRAEVFDCAYARLSSAGMAPVVRGDQVALMMYFAACILNDYRAGAGGDTPMKLPRRAGVDVPWQSPELRGAYVAGTPTPAGLYATGVNLAALPAMQIDQVQRQSLLSAGSWLAAVDLADEVEVLPHLGTPAFVPLPGGALRADIPGLAGLAADERRWVERSDTWKLTREVAGRSPLQAPAIVQRAKVDPAKAWAGSDEVRDTVARYSELCRASGPQMAYDTVLIEAARGLRDAAELVRNEPDSLRQMGDQVRWRVRQRLRRAAERGQVPMPPDAPTVVYWPPWTRRD